MTSYRYTQEGESCIEMVYFSVRVFAKNTRPMGTMYLLVAPEIASSADQPYLRKYQVPL